MFDSLVDFDVDGCEIFESYQMNMGSVLYATYHMI